MKTLRPAIASSVACALLAGIVSVSVSAQGAGAGAAPQAPAGQASGAKAKPEEILAAHTKEDKGGDASAGRPLFEKQCASCHRFGGIGKDVGPDLTTITSRFKKSDTLESILWPSKVISDQYQAEMIELTSGTVVTGVLIRESASAVLIRTGESPDKPVAVPKAQIANRAPSTVSLMPEALLDGLTHEQIANLLAFVHAAPPEK